MSVIICSVYLPGYLLTYPYTHFLLSIGYDRTGEGLQLDRSFFCKYGAPVELENFWMEGYHAMDRLLAQHMLAINNREIPFPPVAGYAGTTHLYKVILEQVLH